MSATLVNGESPGCVSVSNRGLAYGDGVFTTIKVVDRRLQLWRLHRRRLSRDCEKLSLIVDFDTLEREIATICKRLPPLAVLKIILTRGEGQRGYRPSCNEVVRILQAAPFTPYSDSYRTRGVEVTLCRLRLADTPTLAGAKHLNRIEQVLARCEWNDEYQEGLMLDHRGYVIEGTMSNVFIAEGKELLTPLLDRCGVAGIMREHIIANADGNGFNVHEKKISLDELYAARHVFLCNTLIGAWPVACIKAPGKRSRHEYVDFPAFVRQEFSSILAIAEAIE